MKTTNIPGFTAEATLNGSSKRYRIATRPSDNHRVVAQSKMTCAFKAGRLAGRCLQAGYDHQNCMEIAADFNNFCNAYDLWGLLVSIDDVTVEPSSKHKPDGTEWNPGNVFPDYAALHFEPLAITSLKTIRRYEMNMPGFGAESCLGPTMGIYRGKVVYGRFPSEGSGGVMPQLRFQSDPDLGAYWRCRANGGGDLVCRFFGGLPPFTIGGFLTWSIAGVNLAGPSPYRIRFPSVIASYGLWCRKRSP